ncbi:aldehyde dehydrogenase family protein [Pseudomaricurvus alkylphenolicus]|uniref:aldehyde dehydrogenase family protein n=1 Tax=Pseudomaricurvus alkylphenolicus TaxID=1306991 RepID=UPI001981FA5B
MSTREQSSLQRHHISVVDPQDGSLVGKVPSARESDVREAIERASEAFEIARTLPAHVRMSVLNQVADALQQQHEEFATLIAREGIKTIREARKEVTRCVDTLRLSAEEARRLNGETIAFDQAPGSDNRFGYFRRVPIGVIAAITPFNDPLNLVAHKIGPAIAAGNSVILKPHSETPLVAKRLVDLFAQTELPAGILQLITGRGAVIGDILVSDPRVRMVSFTGGREVGEKIIQQAGLKKLAMELGSNCPAIVMPDADMDLALNATVSGAFWAAGQNCLHVQRIYIHQSIYQAFSKQFCQLARAIRVGNKFDENTDMGPMINERAAQKVQSMVADALQKGATLLCGGERRGCFYQPTVLADVGDDCVIASEEVFGPVTLLVPFSSTEEVVAKANGVDYGLQAGIFTSNLDAAFRLADDLDCGGVMINDSSDYRIDAMPFGGVKGSGLGREGVRHAALEMTEAKTYCFNLR